MTLGRCTFPRETLLASIDGGQRTSCDLGKAWLESEKQKAGVGVFTNCGCHILLTPSLTFTSTSAIVNVRPNCGLSMAHARKNEPQDLAGLIVGWPPGMTGLFMPLLSVSGG